MTPKRMLFLPSCFIVASERMATSLPSISMALKARRNDPIMMTVSVIRFRSLPFSARCWLDSKAYVFRVSSLLSQGRSAVFPLKVKASFLSQSWKAVAQSFSFEAEDCGGLGWSLGGVDARLV